MDAPSPQNEERSEARISKGNHKEPTNSVGLPVFEEKTTTAPFEDMANGYPFWFHLGDT